MYWQNALIAMIILATAFTLAPVMSAEAQSFYVRPNKQQKQAPPKRGERRAYTGNYQTVIGELPPPKPTTQFELEEPVSAPPRKKRPRPMGDGGAVMENVYADTFGTCSQADLDMLYEYDHGMGKLQQAGNSMEPSKAPPDMEFMEDIFDEEQLDEFNKAMRDVRTSRDPEDGAIEFSERMKILTKDMTMEDVRKIDFKDENSIIGSTLTNPEKMQNIMKARLRCSFQSDELKQYDPSIKAEKNRSLRSR